MKLKILIVTVFVAMTPFVYADPAVTEPIPTEKLQDLQLYPSSVKNLITRAKSLSTKNLTYQYGSADPANGGMDCSGTIYYLLSQQKIADVPRSSDAMYQWALKQGKLYKVTDLAFDSKDFANLKPGDLLFWSGTYNSTSYISHVMIYLGKDKKGNRLMFGSSDGRTYHNKKMWGVSVFDFKLPNSKAKAKFVGYSCIPSLTC